MSPPSNRPGNADRRGGNEPGDTTRRAIDRAMRHAQVALSEAVASARALLDVASIALSGEPAEAHPKLSEFARTLDQLSNLLPQEAAALRAAALAALLTAIDTEISRWESRSRTDEDARSVLRAFLGLREFLWELGVRPSEERAEQPFATREARRPRQRAEPERAGQRPSASTGRRRTRVQRVEIQ